jgi:Protein of unknown function (DUF4242)
MPSYLMESYAAVSAVDAQRERARLAAELGTDVRHLRTTFLPGDETILHVFEAESPEALHKAARAAELPYDRIVEALEGSRLERASAIHKRVRGKKQ